MSGSYTYTVKQPNAVRCKVDGNNLSRFDISDFIELFLADGPLSEYNTQIFGITTFNYATKVFTLTFNPDTALADIKKFLAVYENGKNLLNASGINITLFAKRLPPPTETVTLYPMPHGVTWDIASNITNGWGNLKSFEYGRHKLLPQIRNSYLHLKLTDINQQNIPERITVNQHYIAVTKPGENIALRCGFCKLKGHKSNDCLEKQRPSNKNQPTNATRRGWKTFVHPHDNPLLSQEHFPELNTSVISDSTARNDAAKASQVLIPSSIINRDNAINAEKLTPENVIQCNAPTPDSTSPATGNTYVTKDTSTEDTPLAHTIEQVHEPKAPPPAPRASDAIQNAPQHKETSQKIVDGMLYLDGMFYRQPPEDQTLSKTHHNIKKPPKKLLMECSVTTECSIFDISDKQPPVDSDSSQEETLITHLQQAVPTVSDTHVFSKENFLSKQNEQLTSVMSSLFDHFSGTKAEQIQNNDSEAYSNQSFSFGNNLPQDFVSNMPDEHAKWKKVERKRDRDSKSPSGLTPPQKCDTRPRSGYKKTHKSRK